jgi:hypothetical protein
MRAALMLLLLVSSQADAGVRRLSECGSLPAAPTEAEPFDLDLCSLRDGDDITELLKDIASRWGAVIVRAPSKTVSVTASGATNWSTAISGKPIKTFVFLEDQDTTNTITIKHVSPGNPVRLWNFSNIIRVRIGGPNLSMSFVGTHPGLGDSTVTEDSGLLRFSMSDGTTGQLADIRANFKNTVSYGIAFQGGDNGPNGEAIANRIQQVNISGVFNNSGFYVLQGVVDLWIDPDRTVVMDPFVLAYGWDGAVARVLADGTSVGCFAEQRRQPRTFPLANAQYVRRITGGVTFQYGTPTANLFLAKYIGNGASQPFRVRYSDYGRSGPTEITGLPAGVLVKSGTRVGVMKHDPLPPYEFTAATGRFIKFEEVPGRYGNGTFFGKIGGASPGSCATATNNDFYSAASFIWFPEASNDGQPVRFLTSYVDVTFSGIAPWYYVDSAWDYIKAAGEGHDAYGGQLDRTYGHLLRVASGARMPGRTRMLDTITVTGPGSWYNPHIAAVKADTGATLNPTDNTITDTHVHGFITVGDNAIRTTISNVDFRGDTARTILTVGAGTTVTMKDICARSGSTITGAGTVVYEGASWSLPKTLGAMAECNVSKDGVPSPPFDVTVD